MQSLNLERDADEPGIAERSSGRPGASPEKRGGLVQRDRRIGFKHRERDSAAVERRPTSSALREGSCQGTCDDRGRFTDRFFRESHPAGDSIVPDVYPSKRTLSHSSTNRRTPHFLHSFMGIKESALGEPLRSSSGRNGPTASAFPKTNQYLVLPAGELEYPASGTVRSWESSF